MPANGYFPIKINVILFIKVTIPNGYRINPITNRGRNFFQCIKTLLSFICVYKNDASSLQTFNTLISTAILLVFASYYQMQFQTHNKRYWQIPSTPCNLTFPSPIACLNSRRGYLIGFL